MLDVVYAELVIARVSGQGPWTQLRSKGFKGEWKRCHIYTPVIMSLFYMENLKPKVGDIQDHGT
jgi:hypothetical protein